MVEALHRHGLKAAPPLQIIRHTLFDAAPWRIGHVAVRNASPAPGEIELQHDNVVVLPMAGLFAKHDGPRHNVLGTPSNAVLIRADRPYRLSYPAGVGDRCLTIRFSDATLSQLLSAAQSHQQLIAASPLLSAQSMLLRNLLWHRVRGSQWDPVEVEELCGMLVESVLQPAGDAEQAQRPRLPGQRAAVDAVKEAISLRPAHKWCVGDLAKVVNASPFHLSRIFRGVTGTSIHDYLLRARLAMALDLLIDTKMDLTSIALDTGFSSHSHFTARFHSFFGITPTAFRRGAESSAADDLRRIVTAPKDRSG